MSDKVEKPVVQALPRNSHFRFRVDQSDLQFQKPDGVGELLIRVDDDAILDKITVEEEFDSNRHPAQRYDVIKAVKFYRGLGSGRFAENGQVLFEQLKGANGKKIYGDVVLLQKGDFNNDGREDFRFVFSDLVEVYPDSVWMNSTITAFGRK